MCLPLLGAEVAVEQIHAGDGPELRFETVDKLLDSGVAGAHVAFGFAASQRQTECQDSAAQRTAGPPRSGDPTAESGGDARDQLRLYTKMLCNCEQYALRSIV